ncbi:nuclease-related domain-containing protein [Leifsonia sp. fls2-241-R2A-40a]|uniref:nuclease-related domain-containing protein n=1 Tax=Leifsonia sp. fls2-241-R2A-40a TaxID=3040290 RepID=UPI00254F73DF|nr:nuclease-related domain-containing protein [Leifsonia sp. fls2-241-R2A-40a]
MTAEAESAASKVMRLRYAGRCANCGKDISAGTVAVYDRSSKSVRCVSCDTPPQDEQIIRGQAGGSAARQHQKLHNAREERIRAAHPKLGGLLLALSDDPQSTRAWARGGDGEMKLGAWLDAAAADTVRPLHDRRIPRSSANIDHLVVTSQGVFVIDAKRYQGQVQQRIEGGLFTKRVEKLVVAGRDRTKLVPGVEKQVARVRSALDAAGLETVPAYGMLCFVDGTWGFFQRPFTVDTVTVLWPKKVAEIVARPGTIDSQTVNRTLRVLAVAFPPYS